MSTYHCVNFEDLRPLGRQVVHCDLKGVMNIFAEVPVIRRTTLHTSDGAFGYQHWCTNILILWTPAFVRCLVVRSDPATQTRNGTEALRFWNSCAFY